jgi:hypothetical protein
VSNVFDRSLGIRQGRITPDGFEQTDDFAFVLGSDDPGYLGNLDPGDYAEVSQSVDLTGVNFIRARLRLRTPEGMPSDRDWEASILIGGSKEATMVSPAGETRDRNDMAANVSKLAGFHTVAFRVELIAV